MTEPTPETASVPAPTPVAIPSQEEIDAALRTLMRAWSPGSIPADAPVDSAALAAEEEYEPYDGCNCAGTDDDGEPLGCNCASGCDCDSCSYSEYARAKTCQAGPCGKATKFRVVGFRLDGGWRSTPDTTQCPHRPEDKCPCSGGVVFLDQGARPVTHQTLTACSAAHARALCEGMVQVYNEPADMPHRLRWYYEQWTYEPHDTELPGPLPALRERLRSAQSCTKAAVRAVASGGDIELWLRYARQDLARAALHAAKPLERPDEDDTFDDEVSSPAQEEPDPWPDTQG